MASLPSNQYFLSSLSAAFFLLREFGIEFLKDTTYNRIRVREIGDNPIEERRDCQERTCEPSKEKNQLG